MMAKCKNKTYQFGLALVCLISSGAELLKTAHAADFSAVNDIIEFEFRAIEKRPLFIPGRVPPVIVAKPLPIATPEPVEVVVEKPPEDILPSIADLKHWKLIGIMRSSDGNVAIFSDGSEEELHRMSVGESLSGWELKEVLARAEIFQNGSVRAKLPFESDKTGTE